MNSQIRFAGLAVSAAMAFSTVANAAGFEKSIVWGGKSGGFAGIAAPYIEGADALYFNPAGLVASKPGHSLSFNISPTSASFKGPINNQNTEVTSESKLLTPVSLIYGNSLSEDLGFGVGFFVSGGANANFPSISFPSSTYTPDVKTDLQIFEASAGVGYRASEDLKLGLAWRVVMAQADLSFVSRVSATSLANAKLTGLKDTQALAFKAGAQYKLDESTDLSLTFRSEVNFEAKGKVQVTGFSSLGGGGTTGAEQDATARTTFPMAINLGGIHRLSEEWNLLAEYGWTQYSRIGEIVVDSAAFSTTGNKTRLTTDWRDQHNARVAAEYVAPWPIRFGYGYTSTVTNADYARASFTPPGPAHTLTVGTGQDFSFGEGSEQSFRFDAAFEYTTTTGDVSGKAASGTTGVGQDTRNGTYSTTAYVAHLGLSYLF